MKDFLSTPAVKFALNPMLLLINFLISGVVWVFFYFILMFSSSPNEGIFLAVLFLSVFICLTTLEVLFTVGFRKATEEKREAHEAALKKSYDDYQEKWRG